MGGPDPLSASKPAGYYQGRADLILTREDLVVLIERSGWHVAGTTPSLAHFLRARRLLAPHGLVWHAGELFAVQRFVLARAGR